MYDDHYGLTGRPFQLTPDPRFYFDSATHRKAMAYLGYGLAQGEGFIVITGEIGTGKTTLVGHLMATIDAARLTAIKIVSTQVEGDDMLRLAAQGMGLNTDGVEKAQILARVERALIDQARAGKRTLLIVDEAQNLAVSALEELRMLSNFQSGGHALLQIFLLGQPEFRTRLNGSERLEQLRQRVIATHHLEPMGADEIEPYIVHRLSLVGWQRNPQFTPEAYVAMYRHSEGVPRRLNALASRVLLFGAIEQHNVIDGADVAAVIADMTGDEMPEAQPAPAPAPAPVAARLAPVRPVPEPVIAEPVAEIAPWPLRRLHFDAPPAAEPQPQPQPEPAPVVAHLPRQEAAQAIDESLKARLALIESRLEEQEASIRRVLTLLVDWVESDAGKPDLHAVRGG